MAQAIATEAHSGVFRTSGEPYINHPARVAARLAVFGLGDEAVAAGWLHDTIEDTWVTAGFLRAAGFPESVIAAVLSVSRAPGESYFGLVARAAADPVGRYVKLADNDDNSADEPCVPAEYRRRVRTLRKYVMARTMLWTAILGAPSACRLPYASGGTRNTGPRRPVNV